jgi:hypothetical protein
VSFEPLAYWPSSKPGVKPYADAEIVKGWFQPENKARLCELMADHPHRYVVELGAWYGASARFFLEQSRDVTVFSVDIWDKELIAAAFKDMCPEFAMPAEMAMLLDEHPIGETFMVNLWEFRDRLVPLKMTSIEGLHHVHRLGLVPDLIYVDANHEFRAVCNDVSTSVSLFPTTKICGDDYSWLDVKRAVNRCAQRHGRALRTKGEFWELGLDGRDVW